MIEHERLKYSKPIDRFEFWIDSNNIKEDIEFVNFHKLESIVINSLNYDGINLNLLNDLQNIKFLDVVSDRVVDFSGLSSLPYLEELYVSDIAKGVSLDFSENKNLRSLNVPTSSFVHADGIKRLTIRYSSLKDFSFTKLTGLTSIEIIKCTNFIDLSKTNPLNHLSSIKLSHMPKLASVKGLEMFKKSLNVLEIENCKNIIDLDTVSMCQNLKRVILYNAGNLSNTSLFKDFNKLEHFVVSGSSRFLSGDLSLITSKGIKHCYIEKKSPN